MMPSVRLTAAGRHILETEHIDLIHATAFEPVKWLMPGARRARIPVLLHVHLPSTEDERCYSWVHQAACIVGSGQAAVKGFREDGLRPDWICVIYNAVDPQRLEAGDARDLRQGLGIGEHETVIAVVGSLIERKNQAMVLEAAGATARPGAPRFPAPPAWRRTGLADPQGSRKQPPTNRRCGGVPRKTPGCRRDSSGHGPHRCDRGAPGDFSVERPRSRVPRAADCRQRHPAASGRRRRRSDRPGGAGAVGPVGVCVGHRTTPGRQAAPTDARDRSTRACARAIPDGRARGALLDLFNHLLSTPAFRYGWIGGTTWPRVYGRWFARFVGTRLRLRPWVSTPLTMTHALLVFAGITLFAMAASAAMAFSLQPDEPQCHLTHESARPLDLRGAADAAHLRSDIEALKTASMMFGSSVSHRPMESDSIDAREGARTAPERARVWCEAVLTKELARAPGLTGRGARRHGNGALRGDGLATAFSTSLWCSREP